MITISTIQEIKNKLSCCEYLSRNGIHVRNGGRCVSPLREGAENPTSFYVEDDHWYDFGSGTGGDVIDLAAHLKYNGDVGAAVRALSAELGIQHQDTNYAKWKDDIQRLCTRTAAYHSALSPSDYEYLAARGFTPEDADRLMIGRVTDGHLKGRLFLPYFKNGAVVYYATRAMPDGAHPGNKYMKAALAESPSYQHIPWGLQTLNRRSDILIISEGYFDALSWEKEGYAVISPITGNFSAAQWPDVIAACHMFERVLIIFDNDEKTGAGETFTERTANRLFREKIPFYVAHTPSGIKDVNDYYANGGNLATLVNSAVDGMKFMASRCKSIKQLQQFIMSIHRYVDSVEIASVLASLSERFSTRELNAIQKAAERPPTEPKIAEEIIRDHQLIYVDQVGFYRWDGRIWSKISDENVRRLADKAYGGFSTAQRISAVCKLLKARTIQEVIFDRNPVLTFQNGTLEIETGRFRDFSQADYCSIMMDYDYDPKARCTQWRRFVSDISDDDPRREEVLQTIAGYILFPDCRLQKIFILLGAGSNGKSVYLEILQALYGNQNVSVVSPTGLTQEFQRVKLKDSLLNIGKDVSPDFSTGEIREWLLQISDGTLIQACYKGQTHITFTPRCKLVYAMNKPPVASVIEGLNRRLHFVKFPCSYVDFPDPAIKTQKQKDINIVPKLMAELPGIFNWAYEGYKLLNTVGYFTDTPEQAEITQQFEEMSDPVSVFCKDYAFAGTITRETVYEWYKEWCDATGHKAMSRERFMPRFRDCMEDQIEDEFRRRQGGRIMRGFVFKDVT